jgi:photosystem II stability/assembly factor-like uncharacterized protein
MIDPIRSRIRGDVLSDYQEPAPDLTRRALSMVAVQSPAHRSSLQTLALTAALVLLAVGILVARGTHLLPISWEARQGGGLRPPLAPYSIVDNQFVSATTGWILIQMHTTSGPTVLLKTSDAGAHWIEQYRYTGQGGIDMIHFSHNGLDGTMSWLEGGAIATPVGSTPPPKAAATPAPTIVKTYQTHDGGTHWTLAFETIEDNPPKTQPPPDYYPGFASAAFYLDNDREGWSLKVPTKSGRDILVMHTTDAGRTWTQVGVLPPGLEGSELSFTDSKNGWLTINQSRGFAFDGQGHPLPTTIAPGLAYVTHDGGHTWAPVTLQLPAGANASNIAVGLSQPVMLDSSHGLMAVTLISGPNSPIDPTKAEQQAPPLAYLVRTTDGGDHWGDLQPLPSGVDPGSIMFLGANHWLAGNGSFLHETRDGGKTWSSRRVLADGMTLSLAEWQYISTSVIWAQVGAGGLIRSTDGGQTWTAVTPPTVH